MTCFTQPKRQFSKSQYIVHVSLFVCLLHCTCTCQKMALCFISVFIQWDPTTDPHSPVPSLIPWQGPFHVSLNAEESTVLLFRPLFEKLYKALFGRNKVNNWLIFTVRVCLKEIPYMFINHKVYFLGAKLTQVAQVALTHNFPYSLFVFKIRYCQRDQNHTEL